MKMGTVTSWGMHLFCFFLLSTTQAFAHDPNPRKVPARYIEFQMKRDKLLQNLDSSVSAKGVYKYSKLWPPSVANLRVCFLDGGKAVRKYVAAVASKWNKGNASVKLDFGSMKNPRICNPNQMSQIRVSFSAPEGGYWSYVGLDSVYDVATASLNLDGFDKKNSSELSNGYYVRVTS